MNLIHTYLLGVLVTWPVFWGLTCGEIQNDPSVVLYSNAQRRVIAFVASTLQSVFWPVCLLITVGRKLA